MTLFESKRFWRVLHGKKTRGEWLCFSQGWSPNYHCWDPMIRAKEKVVIDVHSINANLLAVRDTTYISGLVYSPLFGTQPTFMFFSLLTYADIFFQDIEDISGLPLVVNHRLFFFEGGDLVDLVNRGKPTVNEFRDKFFTGLLILVGNGDRFGYTDTYGYTDPFFFLNSGLNYGKVNIWRSHCEVSKCFSLALSLEVSKSQNSTQNREMKFRAFYYRWWKDQSSELVKLHSGNLT